MSKLAIITVAAASFLGAAGAQAQTRERPTAIENYIALAPGHDVDTVDAQPVQKVMGLSVPNGFREPAPVYERVRPY